MSCGPSEWNIKIRKRKLGRVWGACAFFQQLGKKCATFRQLGKSWAQLFPTWEKMRSTFSNSRKIEFNFFQLPKNWAQLLSTSKKMSSTFSKWQKNELNFSPIGGTALLGHLFGQNQHFLPKYSLSPYAATNTPKTSASIHTTLGQYLNIFVFHFFIISQITQISPNTISSPQTCTSLN